MLKRCAIIVYPEESGTQLKAAFSRLGVESVYVLPQVRAEQPAVYAQQTDGVTIVADNDNLALLSNTLSAMLPLCIIAGSERGVPLADQLCQQLGIAGNEMSLATARYHKYAMAMAAQRAGLRVPRQVCVATMSELRCLMTTEMNWPVVIKPSNSMGSEGVQLCTTAESLSETFEQLLNTENRLGRRIQDCIVQTYLQGTEYAIDTVSVAGRHHLCAFWEYKKSNAAILGLVPFTSKRLMCAHGSVQSQLLEYTSCLLDALGIRYGAAHTELVINNDGVQLMELGARLHGGVLAMDLARLCIGTSQVEVCADAYAKPDTFFQQYKNRYTLLRHGEIVLLIPPKGACRVDPHVLAQIEHLPTVVSIQVNTNDHGALGRIAGAITLSHTDQAAIDAALMTIRDFERTVLYV